MRLWAFTLLVPAALFLTACAARRPATAESMAMEERIQLPPARLEGPLSVEGVMADRRSVRAFTEQGLTQEQIGQLLWAAQGVTSERGYRTAPSAGALFPLELYFLTGEGLYHYDPSSHTLARELSGDLRAKLSEAALNQDSMRQAPFIMVFTAVFSRTESKYGSTRGPRYVHMEVGHSAQNVLLQAQALDLAGVPVGAFHDDRVQDLLRLPADHQPLYLIPIGHPAE
jgi:SagB-type dehydrogenase family enzyme